MAATISGAIKAYIEGRGLGISAYRDKAPEDAADVATQAYITVREGIALVPGPLEDAGDPAALPKLAGEGTVQVGTESVQVDLWQQWRNNLKTDANFGKITESYTLPRAIRRALHGSRLLTDGSSGAPPTTVYSVRVVNVQRMLEADANIVHHAYTLAVHQQI